MFKNNKFNFPVRKAVGMFVTSVAGFLFLAALAVYWSFVFVNATDRSSAVSSTNAAAVAEKKLIKVYFGNSNLDKGSFDCGMVYPVDRLVSVTTDIPRLVLTELLNGLSWSEANAGYYTSINSGVKIKSLKVIDGMVRVDLDKKIEEAVGGSCRVGAIRAQITQTLTSIPSIKSVVISVEGNVDEALQP